MGIQVSKSVGPQYNVSSDVQLNKPLHGDPQRAPSPQSKIQTGVSVFVGDFSFTRIGQFFGGALMGVRGIRNNSVSSKSFKLIWGDFGTDSVWMRSCCTKHGAGGGG